MEFLKGKELSLKDVFLLQLARQQKFEDHSGDLEPYSIELELLMDAGYLKKVKGKKKDLEVAKYRITKEGDTLLSNIETPDITEEDLVLFEWIKGVYKEMGKELGNQKKTKMYIAMFRTQSGIDKNKLARLMSTFVSDEMNMEFNNILEYAFCKPKNVYSTKFVLEDSRLYRYYVKHKDFFDNLFKSL